MGNKGKKKCPYCGHLFKGERGIAIHQRTCSLKRKFSAELERVGILLTNRGVELSAVMQVLIIGRDIPNFKGNSEWDKKLLHNLRAFERKHKIRLSSDEQGRIRAEEARKDGKEAKR